VADDLVPQVHRRRVAPGVADAVGREVDAVTAGVGERSGGGQRPAAAVGPGCGEGGQGGAHHGVRREQVEPVDPAGAATGVTEAARQRAEVVQDVVGDAQAATQRAVPRPGPVTRRP
jgi:hypothetical protein